MTNSRISLIQRSRLSRIRSLKNVQTKTLEKSILALKNNLEDIEKKTVKTLQDLENSQVLNTNNTKNLPVENQQLELAVLAMKIAYARIKEAIEYSADAGNSLHGKVSPTETKRLLKNYKNHVDNKSKRA